MRKNLKFLFAAAMLLCGSSVSAQLTYTHLASSKPNGGENAPLLIDGNQDSKWGEGHNNGTVSYIVFKTSSAVRPSSYTLTNANDTHNSKGRQWVTWNIYGANFLSDVLATKDAADWVLIDQKDGIDEEQFPTANQFQKTTFSLSESSTAYYQYYKIEVVNIRNSGDYMQMGDFAFEKFAEENIIATYTKKVNMAKAFDTSALDAEDLLVKEYKSVVGGIDKALADAKKSGDYTELSAICDQLAFVRSLIETYAAGTEYVTFEGYTDWGDGQPANLLDGNNNTKWGCNIPGEEGGTYIIFRASKAAQPYFYNLVTGGDTQKYAGRNWKTWTIYGANFETTDQAKRDAEGWVLLDKRENIGQDLLPARNHYPAPFSFSEGVAEPYFYFMIEVAEAYEGRAIQMSELLLGTEDEFKAIKQENIDELNAFVLPASATAAQKKANTDAIKAVEKATPETLLTAYTAAKNLQSEIFEASAKAGVYQLGNASDLVAFAALVNGGNNEVDAVLTADIDMSGVEFEPIGAGAAYKGKFDGQGHAICNLTIDNPSSRNKGLFAVIENATIENIMLKGARIVGNEDVGGIVGDAVNSVINMNAVVDSYIEGRDHAGSIAGRIRGGEGCTLSNNYSNSEVNSREYQAGGILGVTTGGTIENNLFLGTVKCGYTNGSGLVSLIDGNETQHMLQNNAVFGSSVDAPNAYSLTNQAGRECNFKNNYSLDKCLYNGNTYGLTNPDDVNGGQVDWIEATTKSFYAETLGWDMENVWKFYFGGAYPVLAWMEYDGPTDLGIQVGESGYATLAIPYDVDFSGVKGIQAYAVYDQGKSVHFEPITSARHGEAVVISTEPNPDEAASEEGTTDSETPEVPAAEADATTIEGNVITIENGGIAPGTQSVLINMSEQGWENREVVEKVKFLGGEINFSKTGKSNDAAFYVVPEGVRMYANNVMTITSSYSQIAKVVITCDTYDGVDYVGNETRTIEQDANNITVTNVYENEVGGVQLRVQTVEIFFANDGGFALPLVESVEGNPDNDLIPAFDDVVADGSQYMLAVVNDVMGFYRVEPESIIPAGKGYLEGTAVTGEDVLPIKGFSKTTTGIANVTTNGQKTNVIYDLTGRRVEKAVKGIYIINGKKVLK